MIITDADLESLIANGGSKQDGKMYVRLFDKRYQDDVSTKCFRLTVALEDYSKVYDTEFWPKGVRITKYWVKKDNDG